VESTRKPVETEKTPTPASDTSVFAASWDVFYQDAQGLECHLQLKGITLDAVLDQAKSASMSITEAGGKPSRRMTGNIHREDKPKETGNENGNRGDNAPNGNNASNANGAPRDPTYIDERGTRRCNRKLTDGTVCGRPVTEKEGRYGAFWSCPNYKSHVPVAPR
jgi:hypothetical protein